MSQNDALATAAHLHVLLRRKTGRVTDTEWLAANLEYAQAIVGFAREKARSDGHVELLPLAERLESLVITPQQRPALAPSLASVPAASASGAAQNPRADNTSRYVGRLR